MRFREWFKSKRAKAIAALGCFAMLLGVGASVSVVSAVKENEVVETKATSEEKGTIYIAVEDQKNGWNDNQYFGCEDNGTVDGIKLVIKSVTFTDASNYTDMSQIETGIISGRVGGTITNNGSTLSIDFADGGWGTNVHNFSIQLPWIIYSITYNYESNVTNRAIYSADMTATAGISYKDFIYHDGWDSAKSRPYHKVSHTNTGYSNEQVDYKTATYYDASISTEDSIYTEDVLYWTYYDPTGVSVDITHRTFVGWFNNASYDDVEFTGPFIWHEEQYAIYGKYEYDQYNITYLDQGGGAYSGSNLASLPSKHTYNTATALVDGAKTGYVFGGWFTNSACTGVAITSLGATAYEAGITLYAKWTAGKFSITLNNHGATTAGTGTIYEKYNDGYYLDSACSTQKMSTSANGISVPSKTGYTFAGYYTLESGGTQYIGANGKLTSSASSTQFFAAGTLHAHWTINSYAVTIAGDDGISSVYLSTSSSATSGSASGTSFNYGATVYGFVVLSAGYAHQNTWARVSGTDDTAGAKYRVGSLTVATSGNDFGTITPISGEDFAIEWATDFNEAIRGEDGGVCKSDGSTTISDLVTAWGGQSTAYAALALAGYKQYWLAEATKSEDSAVTTALAQYDYVCGKYGPNGQKISGITDFMGRDPKPKSAAVIPGAPSANQSPLTLTLWIVLGAGVLGLGAIGTAYFVSKKKKHQA